MTDFRALCAELLDEFVYHTDWSDAEELKDRARAALADGPAVPEGREPASVTGQPSDGELRDLWSWAAGQDQGPWPTQYHCFARAVLARWGNPAPQPPAEGEVEELVAWLRSNALTVKKASGNPANGARQRMNRAADLLRRLSPPQPPADGEVAELVQHLHHAAEVDGWDGASPEWCQSMLRAAELLQRLSPPQPVPVSERLPGPEDCDAEGRCWWWRPSHPEYGYLEGWVLRPSAWGVGHYDFDDSVIHTHWLPATALSLPGQEVGE